MGGGTGTGGDPPRLYDQDADDRRSSDQFTHYEDEIYEPWGFLQIFFFSVACIVLVAIMVALVLN